MKTLLVLLLVGQLLGCALGGEKKKEGVTDLQVVPKEVMVPVRGTCKIVIPKPPIWLTEIVDVDKATDLQISQTITAELEQVRSYLKQVLAEAIKCE